jgi:hypothetical protein
MKIELVESTLVYNISVNEKDYTLYISENANSYYNEELIDENGNPVNDEDLLEQIMGEISDLPHRF